MKISRYDLERMSEAASRARYTVPSQRPAIAPNKIYTLEEAAYALGVTPSVVDWARYGEGEKRLSSCKFGASIRFRGEELLRWVRVCEEPEGQEEEIVIKGLTLDQVFHAALQLRDSDRVKLIERLMEGRI